MSNGINQATAAFANELEPGSGKSSDPSSVEDSVFDNLATDIEGEPSDAEDPERYVPAEFSTEEAKPPAKKAKAGPKDPEEDEEERQDVEEQDEEEQDEEEEDEDLEELAARTHGLPPDHKVTVKIDGKDKDVPLREALDGYIRTETFHTRLNELRDVAMSVQAEAAKVTETRDRYADLLKTLQEQVDSLSPPEPDWDQMAKDHGHEEAFRQKLQWEKFGKQRGAIIEEQARVAKEQREAQVQDLKNYVVAERHKMMKIVPSWNDEKIRKRDMNSMNETALAVGFTQDEVDTVYDHRMMLILRDAAAYRRLIARKPKPNGEVTREAKPGAGATRTAPKAQPRARSNIPSISSDVSSIDVATSVFARELANESRRARRNR